MTANSKYGAPGLASRRAVVLGAAALPVLAASAAQSNWPDIQGRPRSTTVAIRRADGHKINRSSARTHIDHRGGG